MALEIEGKLIQIFPEQTGTGKNGAWTKQEFLIETKDQYPRKILFNVWNDKAASLKKLSEGAAIKVSFNAESREYNGRWYTDLRAWKIDSLGKAQEKSESGFSTPAEEAPPAADPGNDDLPF
jgi:hypothetical protein